ncbi:hypothetical protein D3C86_2028960 [compost metagenome]
MLIQHFCIIACIFLGGKRIDVAANRVELFSNILGAVPVGSFEQHMLNKMRNPVVLRSLIAGACFDPYSKGNGSAGGNFFSYHSEAV